jgi:hypothetical protein
MRAALALASVAALLALLASCRSPGTRPTDMSAPEHEARADQERAKAAEVGRKYDPDDTATMIVDSGAGVGETGAAGSSMGIVDYNPTERYRVAAQQHERIAAQHERAAAKLRAFEDQACTGFTPAVRASCPLLGPVRKVVDVVGGARVELANPAEANAIASHIRCHVAFANANGVAEEDMDECPLYLKGLTVDVNNDGALVFKVKSADELKRLRTLLREHITR